MLNKEGNEGSNSKGDGSSETQNVLNPDGNISGSNLRSISED